MTRAEPLGSVFAPAKINLALHVVGRRADGYHLIDSLVAFASVGDRIEAFPAGEGRPPLAIEGRFSGDLAADAGNLVIGAERVLRQHVPALPPLALRLTKDLPVSSGIGGGSADGAATLRLLAGIAGGVAPEALGRLALALGADGPMCLRSAPLRARGIGETITDWPDLPPLDLVLVNPGLAVSTPSVFRRLQRADNPPLAPTLPRLADGAALAAYLGAETRNDLETPAIAEAGAIAAAKAALAGSDDCMLARMSGSGATVFGLYPDGATAGRAAAVIGRAHPAWWVTAARTITPEHAMPRGARQLM